MKHKILLTLLVLSFFLISKYSLSDSLQKGNYGTYISISFQSPIIFKDSTLQNNIKRNIEKVFKDAGMHIIHTEKPEEFKLNVNIVINDSLIIEAQSISIGDGMSMIKVNKPKITYKYENERDIYYLIKNYIKKYL